MQKNKFYIGYENSGEKCDHKTEFFNAAAAQEFEVDFIVHHIRPDKTVAEEVEFAKNMAAKFDKHHIEFIPNCETANWRADFAGPDGFDWATGPEGSHRFRFPKEVMDAYAASPMFAGVLYDEAEHCIINRNLSLTHQNKNIDMPFFPDRPDFDIQQTSRHIYECSLALLNECKTNGAKRVLGEHVFPVLLHTFAKAGITPNYKQQKEGWSNIFAACAMGAAKQYNTELWTCIDLWFGLLYPGHSPKEMEYNLRYAFLIGVDRAYVESCKDFYAMPNKDELQLTEYGEAFKRFSTVYLKENNRNYTHRDFEPLIAIIHFDDGDWGQTDDWVWKAMLLGNKNLKPDDATHEWLRAWHTISHGNTKVESLYWGRMEAYAETPHRSFAPVNSPIVYDETVKKELLESLKLCFLCGVFISDETLADVATLVKENGLTVVTSKRFAPKHIVSEHHGEFTEITDGNGRWIITDDMASDAVKVAVAPLLGENDKMTYRFKCGKTICLKIAEDGDSFEEL